MVRKLEDVDDAGERVIDYSDPAQEPHESAPRYRRNDTGGFVAAGVAVAMVIVGGFIYAGYLTENITIQPRQIADVQTTSSIGQATQTKAPSDQAH